MPDFNKSLPMQSIAANSVYSTKLLTKTCPFNLATSLRGQEKDYQFYQNLSIHEKNEKDKSNFKALPLPDLKCNLTPKKQ